MDKSRTKVMEVGSAKYDNQLRRPSFISLLWQSYDKSMGMFANNSSFHGWNWYLKVSNAWKKVLVFSPIQGVPLQHVITDAGNPLYQIATQIYKQKLQYTITQIAVKCKNCGMELRFYFIVI